MNANDWIDTGIEMPRLGAVKVVAPFALEVLWAAGERSGRTDVVDLTPALLSYKAFRPLRDAEGLFATAHLGEDGYAVAWDGIDIDMSADLIEQLADETMTSSEFAAFLKRNRLTQEAAAVLLGRSRRQIGYYLKPGPVPRIVALACLGYEALQKRRKSAA